MTAALPLASAISGPPSLRHYILLIAIFSTHG
jgi:hypothetical protein